MHLLHSLMLRTPISDTEFIERTRTRVRISKRLRIPHGILGFLFLGLSGWGALLLPRILSDFSKEEPGSRPLIFGLFATAVVMGLSLGFAFHKAADAVIRAFSTDRTAILLLECWDRLHPRDNGDTPVRANQSVQRTAGSVAVSSVSPAIRRR